MISSFLCLVLLPVLVSATYLWTRAADQFVSHVAFSVRQAGAPAASALTGLAGLAGMGATGDESQILNDFLRSRDVVAKIDRDLDLRSIWSHPKNRDPVFAFDPAGTIEDLHSYWAHMVDLRFEATSGLITAQVRAFDPDDALAIAAALHDQGRKKIIELGSIAHDDSIRFARVDLAEAETRLSAARQNLTAFRNRTQIVDPLASLEGQMGLVTSLQGQLADAMIRHDLLAGTTRPDDPRLLRIAKEIEVIQKRLKEEEAKLGLGSAVGGTSRLADLFGEYERLEVELGFAREAYLLAQASLDSAKAEARRQTSYLAAHVPPTLAERAEHPKRAQLVLAVFAFLFLGWSLITLTLLSLSDRK